MQRIFVGWGKKSMEEISSPRISVADLQVIQSPLRISQAHCLHQSYWK